jgi:hypothetical protein
VAAALLAVLAPAVTCTRRSSRCTSSASSAPRSRSSRTSTA